MVEDVGLADPSLIEERQEFGDGITVAIQSMFPTCVNQQIYNTLALRQLVPQGPGQADCTGPSSATRTTILNCATCA